MSTRANIVIKDQDDELIFYRHSDGYPEGTLPTLEKFLSYVKEGRIRDNVGQAAGWLIVIGREEYRGENGFGGTEPGNGNSVYGWKVGAYEPTTCIHGDIEHFYVVDLEKKTIRHSEAGNISYSGKFRKGNSLRIAEYVVRFDKREPPRSS